MTSANVPNNKYIVVDITRANEDYGLKFEFIKYLRDRTKCIIYLIGDYEAGEKFYNTNCFVCHGKKGDGKGPRAHFNRPAPRNFTSDASRQELDHASLFAAISNGKRGSVMPAWSTVLTEQQIADVAEYVYQSFIQVKKKSR